MLLVNLEEERSFQSKLIRLPQATVGILKMYQFQPMIKDMKDLKQICWS